MEFNNLCHFVIVLVGVLVESISASESSCSLYSLRSACPDPNEACYEQNNSTAVCICKPGYSKQHHEEPCKLTRPSTATNSHSEDQPTMPEAEHSTKISGSTIAASIFIPLVLIVAVVGLVFAARRYRWLHRLQHPRPQHYDEVRIGQEDDDDPPIS